jgi:hypothetical protein
MSTILKIAQKQLLFATSIPSDEKNFKHTMYHDKQTVRTQRNEKWITLTLYSPLVRKVTNLFKQTNVQITIKTANTFFDMLKPKTIMQDKYVCRKFDKLTWQTCGKLYMGQMGSLLKAGSTNSTDI